MLHVAHKAMLSFCCLSAALQKDFKLNSCISSASTLTTPLPTNSHCQWQRGTGWGGVRANSATTTAAVGELTTVREPSHSAGKQPAGPGPASEAARRVLSGRRCIYLASANGQMDESTHGLFAFATAQTNRTHNKKNLNCSWQASGAGFLIANAIAIVVVAVVGVRVVLCV